MAPAPAALDVEREFGGPTRGSSTTIYTKVQGALVDEAPGGGKQASSDRLNEPPLCESR
jgi:hypothetical protein